MTLEYNTLSITVEKERLVAEKQNKTNEGVGERDISNQQNGGKWLTMRISYDAKGRRYGVVSQGGRERAGLLSGW